MTLDRNARRRPANRPMPVQAQRRQHGPMPNPYGRAYAPVAPAQPFRQNYRARSKRNVASIGIVALLVAAIAFAGWFSFQALQGGLPVADADARADSSQPVSTPKAEWKQGVVPTLYQKDPAWANVRYAENNFGESGCGPTCMSMVYIALTGKTDLDPAAMAQIATNGGYGSEDGTAWSFMTEGAAAVGLAAEELPADETSIRQSLVAGRPVICSMGPGDFTSIGHFIVLTDIDQNGKLVVRDPNSPARTAETWTFSDVISQCRNLWSYSAV